jgi:hypothetical protein
VCFGKPSEIVKRNLSTHTPTASWFICSLVPGWKMQSCAWLENDGAGGERMQLFKIGEAVWAPAETHGGTTINVAQECRILEIEIL